MGASSDLQLKEFDAALTPQNNRVPKLSMPHSRTKSMAADVTQRAPSTESLNRIDTTENQDNKSIDKEQ